jgi:hypothetical protein
MRWRKRIERPTRTRRWTKRADDDADREREQGATTVFESVLKRSRRSSSEHPKQIANDQVRRLHRDLIDGAPVSATFEQR